MRTYELLQIVLFLQSVQLVLQLKDQKGTSKAYYVCYGCCFLKIFSAGKDFQDSAASGKSLCSPPVILYKHEIPYLSISSFDSSVGRAVDCSGAADIHRSLVRIRLEGYLNFSFFQQYFFLC